MFDLPYGKHYIHADDICAVTEAMKSGWLTTGPMVAEYEKAFAQKTGFEHAVAVCNGTAALHVMLAAAGIGPGDEVIVPDMTFVATANAVLMTGAQPVIADVDPETLLMFPSSTEELITGKTAAIIAVDYAGQPCDYKVFRKICDSRGLKLFADAAHSLGATRNGEPPWAGCNAAAFSTHPVKSITTAEGGVITTHNPELAYYARRFRDHGREKGLCTSLGWNYRLSELHCALGLSQLKKLDRFIYMRQVIAAQYDQAFENDERITPLLQIPGSKSARHIYVVKVPDRDRVRNALAERGVGTQVHYTPLHDQPLHAGRHGRWRCCDGVKDRILTLPLYPVLTGDEMEHVIKSVKEVLHG